MLSVLSSRIGPDVSRDFAKYATGKTARAERAEIHPLRTEIDHATGRRPAVGNDWTRDRFDGSFYLSPAASSTAPACALVFVQSRDGNTGAENPLTLGGGLADKHLIYEGLSQVAADAVLAGAGTVRGGDIVFAVWHPELVRLRQSLGKPRYPTQIVATLHGMDLDSSLLFNVPEIPVILLTGSQGLRKMEHQLATRSWVSSLVMERPKALATAFAELRAQGIDRITSVGGRHLATQLIDAGLVQDLYLTTSPQPGGEPGTPFYPRPLPGTTIVRKHGTGEDQGVVFEQIAIDAQVDSAPRRADSKST